MPSRFRPHCFCAGLPMLILAGAAAYGQETEVSGRNIQHITEFDRTEISERHFMAAIEATGVTIAADGEVTTNKMWGQIDRIDGAGSDRGYFVRVWPDGSMIIERFESEASLDAGGASVFRGTLEYVFGTGRFEGVTGAGYSRAGPMTTA